MSICWTHPGAVETDDVPRVIWCFYRFRDRTVGLGDTPGVTGMTDRLVLDPVQDLADIHGVRAVVQERHDGDDRGDAEHDRHGNREVRDDGIPPGLGRGSH